MSPKHNLIQTEAMPVSYRAARIRRVVASRVACGSKHDPAHGFAILELLMVIVVVVIFLAVTLPNLTDAALEQREREERVDLVVFEVRSKLEVYRQQHGAYPSVSQFESAMTGRTARGEIVLGPYLNEVPVNPVTGGREIGDGAAGSSDWYYDGARGSFMANHADEAEKR